MHDLTAARKNARTDEDAAAIAWAQDEIERRTGAMDELIAWHRILLAKAGDVAYRMVSREPTPAFYRDLAEELESLAKRVRRNIKE